MQYGTDSPEALVDAAAAAGFSYAAITDRDGLYGAIRHIRACIEKGIMPIVGCELLVEHQNEISTVTIIARGNSDGLGWAALCRVISAAHSSRRRKQRSSGSNERRPVLDARAIPKFFSDLNNPECAVLLSPNSDVGRALAQNKSAQAGTRLRAWRDLLGKSLCLEIVCHYTEPETVGSLRHAAKMLSLSDELSVQAVLTNAVRFASPGGVITADILNAAGQLTHLDAAKAAPNAQAWLKNPERMLAVMTEIGAQPGVPRRALGSLLSATQKLAQRSALNPEKDLGWRKAKLPELQVAGISGDPVRVLFDRAHSGLSLRYSNSSATELDKLEKRLRVELETIQNFGYASYFLTVADVADLIRGMGIRSQARGSGAGSLVNYVLGISSVDPVAHDLLFERFLSSNRETLPDIDIDVESARRHEIYHAIMRKYGETRVTLLSMRTGYRARSAARDTGRALGIDEKDIDTIAKHIWRFNARDFRAVLEQKPELKPVAERASQDSRINQLIDLSGLLDRLPRHLSMHPCGVILSNENLLSNTPVQPSGLGIAMSQFDKDDIDDIGFLKLDVLGVRMQSAIAHTLGEVQRARGVEARKLLPASENPEVVNHQGQLNLEAIRLDDFKTFETIKTTHTIGLFQIESPGQRELLGKLQPSVFEDLIADISLFRPGPMKGNMIAPFVDARHGITSPSYLHPRFVEILKPTFGVVIYHEQVIRVLADCMGITLSKADEYRRAMNGDTTVLERQFRQATASRKDHKTGKNLFTAEDIDRIWNVLEGFGSFGFCKAHGAAFALPTYQTAWLKTYFPAEFFAGLLTHDPGMYPKRLLLTEAKRLGIPIFGIDVNRSKSEYRVEWKETSPQKKELGIRLALSNIRNITRRETDRITSGQPFSSVEDFDARARPSTRLRKALEELGGFNSIPPFETLSTPSESNCFPDSLPEMTSHENRARNELTLLGLDVSSHVLDQYRPLLNQLGVTPADELINLYNSTQVLVAGVRVATQTPPTRSGKRIVFITLDDGSGCADITFFEDAQLRAGPLLFTHSLLLISGKTRRTGKRGISIVAENAWSVTELSRNRNIRQLA